MSEIELKVDKRMIICILIGVLILAIFIPRYLSSSGNMITNKNTYGKLEKVEVYHFHGTNQCYSCKTVGAYAEETVNTYFFSEIESGKLVFDHLNIDLPENNEIAMKYGATGSSLMIGVYNGDGFHAEEDTNVWYKINNKEDYMQYLKGIIDRKFLGD